MATSYNFSLRDMVGSTSKDVLGFDVYTFLSDYAYQIGAVAGMAVYSYYLNRNYIKTLYQIATPAGLYVIEDYFSDSMKDNLSTVALTAFGGLLLGNRYVVSDDANMLMSGILWRTGVAVGSGMVASRFLARVP
jgi:hypothetical protein